MCITHIYCQMWISTLTKSRTPSFFRKCHLFKSSRWIGSVSMKVYSADAIRLSFHTALSRCTDARDVLLSSGKRLVFAACTKFSFRPLISTLPLTYSYTIYTSYSRTSSLCRSKVCAWTHLLTDQFSFKSVEFMLVQKLLSKKIRDNVSYALGNWKSFKVSLQFW